VVCSPSKVHQGGGWATSEAADLVGLVEHLQSALPIEKHHLHVLTTDPWGFATFVAFDKRVQSASLCLVNVETYRGGKLPPDTAKKQLAVLSLYQGAARGGDGRDVTKILAGKVRTLEWRKESPLDPYFRYWLLVADDRFTPGVDLSFPWLEDSPLPREAKAGEKSAAAPESAFARAKQRAADEKRGAFVYFWSKTDAGKAESRAVQNDLLFRQDVRDLGAKLVPVKVERERDEAAFAGLGLKSTPALVVLDPAFAPVKVFEGAIDAAAFVAALRKTVPEEKKAK
jgi:hypothetical protein